MVVKAAVVLGAGALLVYLGMTVRNGLPFKSYYTLHAEFRGLGNLENHDDVRLGGVRVGQVLDFRRSHATSVVDLQLDRVRRLPADSTARVRSVSLLGAAYVEIERGKATRVLPDGATLGAAKTSTSPDLPALLSAFDPSTRNATRALVRALGEGYLGRGAQLNDAAVKLPPYLNDIANLSHAINRRGGAAARFFPSLESAAQAALPVREQIARGFDPEARAVDPFRQHGQAVERFISAAAAGLPRIRSSLRATDPLLSAADDFLGASRAVTKPAPAAMRQASALLAESDAPLAKSRPLLAGTRRAVPSVVKFATRLDPDIPPLRNTLQNSLPLLDEMRVRRCDFVGWAANWRSFLEFGFDGGRSDIGPLNVLRFESVLNDETSAGGGSATPNHATNDDPYPRPCRATGGDQP
jgi:phospholipid/cholesterol/gamma-HCH transport system substrate-binding protein